MLVHIAGACLFRFLPDCGRLARRVPAEPALTRKANIGRALVVASALYNIADEQGKAQKVKHDTNVFAHGGVSRGGRGYGRAVSISRPG